MGTEFTIRLAGQTIAVRSIYGMVREMCRDYMTDDTDTPDLTAKVSPADIENERVRSVREAQIEGTARADLRDSYLETLAVYRKIAAGMLSHDTFLMHGAVIAVGDRAWLFTAPSGTGKTTHIRLWLDNIPGSRVVNGDKPLIRVSDEITVYGTPWAGKEGMQKNEGVRLCGIVLLERGAENHIEQILFSSALPVMIQQSYRPNDKTMLEKTLELIGKLGTRVPLYRLQCNMLPEAALTAYKALAGSAAERINT